jgi:hypothetical protein
VPIYDFARLTVGVYSFGSESAILPFSGESQDYTFEWWKSGRLFLKVELPRPDQRIAPCPNAGSVKLKKASANMALFMMFSPSQPGSMRSQSRWNGKLEKL